MKNQAFTLIEILVVILIIGILAAIAFPQYQTSVDRSRYSEMMFLVKHIKDAQELFYLQNYRYANDCQELGIEIPSGLYLSNDKASLRYKGTGNQYIECFHGSRGVAGITERFGGVVSYEDNFRHTNYDRKGSIMYYASNSSGKRGERLVKSFCLDLPLVTKNNALACHINE